MPRGRPAKKKPARKPPLKARVAKAIQAVKPDAGLLQKRTSARINEQSRALFVDHHLPEIMKFRAQVQTANGKLRAGYKAAKADGFLKRDFDVAIRLSTQTGERDIRAEIAREMTVAKWLKRKLGDQLDLFVDTEPDEGVEGAAYAAGEEASVRGKPADPMYAPETEGYEAYMQGYRDHQERLAKNIKKLEPKAETTSSGVPLTRSQFRAQQAAKAKADAAEERSLFTKRTPPPDEAAE